MWHASIAFSEPCSECVPAAPAAGLDQEVYELPAFPEHFIGQPFSRVAQYLHHSRQVVLLGLGCTDAGRDRVMLAPSEQVRATEGCWLDVGSGQQDACGHSKVQASKVLTACMGDWGLGGAQCIQHCQAHSACECRTFASAHRVLACAPCLCAGHCGRGQRLHHLQQHQGAAGAGGGRGSSLPRLDDGQQVGSTQVGSAPSASAPRVYDCGCLQCFAGSADLIGDGIRACKHQEYHELQMRARKGCCKIRSGRCLRVNSGNLHIFEG